jgi:hypothetical protein
VAIIAGIVFPTADQPGRKIDMAGVVMVYNDDKVLPQHCKSFSDCADAGVADHYRNHWYLFG